MELDLSTKIALVTGGGSGIGWGCAQVLSSAGCSVIINDIDAVAGERAVETLRQQGQPAEFIQADVADEAAVQRLADHVGATHSRLHVLVNNAGFNLFKNLGDTSPAEWDQIMNVDLRGLYLVTRAMLPMLRAAGQSSVINIASVHAHLTIADITAYAAAKGGVVALTRSLCQELGPQGVRVNSVSPGFVHTPLLERWLASVPDAAATLREVNGYHPLGRIGTPADVGHLVAFLASDQASFITGTDITIDGGLTSRLMH